MPLTGDPAQTRQPKPENISKKMRYRCTSRSLTAAPCNDDGYRRHTAQSAQPPSRSADQRRKRTTPHGRTRNKKQKRNANKIQRPRLSKYCRITVVIQSLLSRHSRQPVRDTACTAHPTRSAGQHAGVRRSPVPHNVARGSGGVPNGPPAAAPRSYHPPSHRSAPTRHRRQQTGAASDRRCTLHLDRSRPRLERERVRPAASRRPPPARPGGGAAAGLGSWQVVLPLSPHT